MGASSQLFSEINTIFVAQKEDKLDDTSTSPLHSTSSSQERPTSLNLGGSWNDDTPTIVNSSTSPTLSNDNQEEIMVLGN
jgi:hypothetical protein